MSVKVALFHTFPSLSPLGESDVLPDGRISSFVDSGCVNNCGSVELFVNGVETVEFGPGRVAAKLLEPKTAKECRSTGMIARRLIIRMRYSNLLLSRSTKVSAKKRPSTCYDCEILCLVKNEVGILIILGSCLNQKY